MISGMRKIERSVKPASKQHDRRLIGPTELPADSDPSVARIAAESSQTKSTMQHSLRNAIKGWTTKSVLFEGTLGRSNNNRGEASNKLFAYMDAHPSRKADAIVMLDLIIGIVNVRDPNARQPSDQRRSLSSCALASDGEISAGSA